MNMNWGSRFIELKSHARHGVSNHRQIYRLFDRLFMFRDVANSFARGPHYWHQLTLILTWISNHGSSEAWAGLTCHFSNFNSCTMKFKKWIHNFTTHFAYNSSPILRLKFTTLPSPEPWRVELSKISAKHIHPLHPAVIGLMWILLRAAQTIGAVTSI